jgi:hypothetical protein
MDNSLALSVRVLEMHILRLLHHLKLKLAFDALSSFAIIEIEKERRRL